MNSKTTSQYQGEADIFKALSHPTRLFILDAIKDQSYSVSQLAQLAGIDISTMSKHLDLLKRYNIVTGVKDRNTVYYKLNVPCLFDFIRCAKNIINCPSDCPEFSCPDPNPEEL